MGLTFYEVITVDALFFDTYVRLPYTPPFHFQNKNFFSFNYFLVFEKGVFKHQGSFLLRFFLIKNGAVKKCSNGSRFPDNL